MRVPFFRAAGRISPLKIEKPSLPSTLEDRCKSATLAMEAKASPRKPKLEIDSNSSKFLTLLVACLFKARAKDSLGIPHPLS